MAVSRSGFPLAAFQQASRPVPSRPAPLVLSRPKKFISVLSLSVIERILGSACLSCRYGRRLNREPVPCRRTRPVNHVLFAGMS